MILGFKNKKRIYKITKKGDRNFYLLCVGFYIFL